VRLPALPLDSMAHAVVGPAAILALASTRKGFLDRTCVFGHGPEDTVVGDEPEAHDCVVRNGTRARESLVSFRGNLCSTESGHSRWEPPVAAASVTGRR
jgi:hypothetical protein